MDATLPPLRWKAEPEASSSATPAPTWPKEEPVVSPVSLDRQTSTSKRRREKQESTRKPKPRKPSYVVQREERDVLAEECRQLEEQLELLRLEAGLPTRQDKAAIAHAEARNFDIQEKLHMNDLFLARVNSMVSREMLVPAANPLSLYIHLPVEMDERRRILRDMQELKLRRAQEVTFERLHHLDHAQPYLSEERFTTADGKFHCIRLSIHQFPNFKSAKDLFDCYVHFLYNMEITVTEMLGQLTIREDQEDIDPTIWNQRIVTVADNVGCTEELNIVGFARFYDESSGRPGAPYGVVAYDTVNVDDLYPYRPEERTCKDVQSAVVACEVQLPDSDERVPVLKQCFFTTQLPPQFPMEPDKLQQLQDNVSRWPELMAKYLREFVAPE